VETVFGTKCIHKGIDNCIIY